MNILDAIRDPNLFGGFFKSPESWRSWRVFLSALFGLPVEDAHLFSECTGSRPLPATAAREAFLVVGRRGGKSFVCALVGIFLAAFRTYQLSPGEKAVIMLLAADRKQARVLLRYAKAFAEGVPMIRGMIESTTAEAIELNNGVVVEVHTSSFRSVRGYTIAACLADEIAFWRSDESANPDVEILNAIRPAMATIPNSLLLCLSTPYARNGALWSAYRKHFGKAGDVLVWQAPTRTMNPLVPAAVIDSAYEEDPGAAAAEYGASFRSDLESYITQEVVDAVVVPDRYELPPVAGTRYFGFCDPSGGSGSDAFTLAVGHAERDTAVLDLIRERKPRFSPESVVAEYAQTLKAYGLASVMGDKYAGDWPGEAFRKHGINYKISERTKSEIYQGMLPMLNSMRVELLDNKVLRTQLCGLERRTARSGKDSIDHRAGSHDDIINSTAGCLVQCTPSVELTADMFAQGTISFVGRRDEEMTLWS